MKRISSIGSVLFLLLTGSCEVFAQPANLLENPGFEDQFLCHPRIRNVHGWRPPALFDTIYGDYFINCDLDPLYKAASNYQGSESHARYAGIRVFDSITHKKEYLVGSLDNPAINTLIAGRRYYFEMEVSLSDSSLLYAGIGAAFVRWDALTNPLLQDSSQGNIDFISPQVTNLSPVLTHSGWTKVRGMFTAFGGETNIVIGNFEKYPATIAIFPFTHLYSYYYIDNVLLYECPATPESNSTGFVPLGNDTAICGAGPFAIKLNKNHYHADRYFWSNLPPDPPGGIPRDTQTVTQPGKYWIYLRYDTPSCFVDFADSIEIKRVPSPSVNLGHDTSLCNQLSFTISAKQTDTVPTNYLWSNGAQTPQLSINTAGTYWVKVTNGDYCFATDTIVVKRPGVTVNDLGPDTVICFGTPVTLKSKYPYLIPVNYLWNTNGTKDTIATNTPGTYWLEINNQGCIKRDTIQVSNTTLQPFTLSDAVTCSDQPHAFIATTPGAISYKWSRGDSTDMILADTGGLYWAQAFNGPCVVSDTAFLLVKPTPMVSLGNDTVLCSNQLLTLDAGKADSSIYLWNNNATSRYLTVTAQGLYWARVNRNGCTAEDSMVLITTNPPALELGNDTLMCEGSKLLLQAYSLGSTYLWHVPTGQTGDTTSFSWEVTDNGIYQVEVKQGICTIMDSVYVQYVARPLFDLGADSFVCFNNPVLLDASSSNGEAYLWQDGSTQPTLLAKVPNKYTVEVKKSICWFRDSVQLAQKTLPQVNLTADTLQCKGTKVVLDAGEDGVSYLWNDNSTGKTLETKAPNLVTVKVTNTGGCYTIDSILLDTFPTPQVNLGKDSFVCEGMSYKLSTAKSYSSYLWNDGSGSPQLTTAKGGTFWLRVKDEHQCYGGDTVVVGYKLKPEINLEPTINVCEPDFELEPPKGYLSYEWQDASTSETYHVTSYGIYTLKVTDHNYCTNTSITEVVNSCEPLVLMPNVFSPNGDNVNDLLTPAIMNVITIHYEVYNRWGEKVFETDELNKGWDGKSKDHAAGGSVYLYKVTYTGISGKPGIKEGNVTLLR